MSSAEILLIEDNPDDAELTIHALRKSGIANDISHIADGQLALERLLDDTLPVAMLVLLDLSSEDRKPRFKVSVKPGLAECAACDRGVEHDCQPKSRVCRITC